MPRHKLTPRQKGDGRGQLGGGSGGSLRKSTRAKLLGLQSISELDVPAVVEQIARGALFDPREFFYAEPGVEFYAADGPPMLCDASPDCRCVQCAAMCAADVRPQWRKGDVKRMWQTGDLKPIHELTEAQAQAIAGVEVVMKNATAGDGQIDRVLKLKFAPRDKYVDMAGRYHALFREVVEHVGLEESTQRLLAGRQRARERNRLLNASAIDVTAVVVESTKVER